jgi:purine-binding chemotaxis protein CheW
MGKQVIGFLVDAVSEIFSGKDDDIQPTPDVASAATRNLIQGVIAGEGRMISVLSLDRIAATSEVMAA